MQIQSVESNTMYSPHVIDLERIGLAIANGNILSFDSESDIQIQ